MNTSNKSFNIVVGVATLPERSEFFENEVLPSLVDQVNQVIVFHDGLEEPRHIPFEEKVTRFYGGRERWGDAGKFVGFGTWPADDFYYFTCDDDLIYPPDYCERMIEWINFFDKKAVVALHGTTFKELPTNSYYYGRRTYPCLGDIAAPQRVLFPGTGCTAFHNTCIQPKMRDFKVPNMADIWFGLILQREKIPAVVLPHHRDYLTYNPDLPLENTIWGREHKDDFVQTAIVNQFSLDPGFQLFPYPRPLEGDLYASLPRPLDPYAVPRPSEESSAPAP